MRKIYLYPICVMTILWLGISGVNAAPFISSSSGTAVDGESMIITGTSFGTNALSKVEWLGGTNGNIEQGVAGKNFAKDGWSNGTESSSTYPAKYTDANAHSGLKSIISQWPLEEQYSSGFGYDTGITGVGKIYVTWWTHFDHADSAGQWKKWRLRHNSSVSDSDGEIYENNWYTGTGTGSSSQFYIYCDLSSLNQCYPNSDYSLRDIYVQPVDKWIRYEVYAEESSDDGMRDGTIKVYRHYQTSVVSAFKDYDNDIITRATGVTNRWRYFIFQNYWGNISTGSGTKEKVYIDDIFIQVGTQARVEIGDSPTWANCKHREIQVPTAWASSRVAFTFNQGSFAAGGSVYLYVVDLDGNVSDMDPNQAGAQGYPITIGGGGSITPPGSPTLHNPS
jgi:hypothetical protein